MMVSAGATLAYVGDMRSTSGSWILRAGGWIEGLSLLSYMRGSSAAIRLVHLFMNANRMLAAVYAHTSASEHSHGNSDSS